METPFFLLFVSVILFGLFSTFLTMRINRKGYAWFFGPLFFWVGVVGSFSTAFVMLIVCIDNLK